MPSPGREWLTEYEVFRDAELKAGFSYFVFEEVAQRLDDFFEIYVIRQSSDVMMGFDDGGFSADAALSQRLGRWFPVPGSLQHQFSLLLLRRHE